MNKNNVKQMWKWVKQYDCHFEIKKNEMSSLEKDKSKWLCIEVVSGRKWVKWMLERCQIAVEDRTGKLAVGKDDI